MKSVLPQAKDWNHFWGLEETQSFTKLSWSKRRILALTQSFLRPGTAILDAGCGSGFFAEYFWRQGMDATAVDYAEEALRITRERTQGKIPVIKTDLIQTSLSSVCSSAFDVIFTDGLLEHFTEQDQDRILQNFKSVLKTEGVIITFVPNQFSPWELIRPFYMPGIVEKPFTLKRLIRLNERNELKIIGCGGTNTLPFRFSPDKVIGSCFGMLLYTFAKKS